MLINRCWVSNQTWLWSYLWHKCTNMYYWCVRHGGKDLSYSLNNHFISLNRWSFNSSHNKYTWLNTLSDMLCLLDNNRYYDYIHQFYMLLRTRLCEGFCSKLCNCSNQLKSSLHFNYEFTIVGFKTKSIQMCNTQQLMLIGMVQ
jgi:hypothetical protein